MPRLPVDGKKVIEYRITLGTYEREQLNRYVDGMQVKNIGTGIGSITDPIEALFSTTMGTIGGVYFAAWALKRFFDIDVPIPTDLEDIQEGWALILDAVNLDQEGREKLAKYVEDIQLGKKAELLGSLPGLGGLKLIDPSYTFLKGMANFIFTPLQNPRYGPTAEEQAAYEATSPAPGSYPLPGDPDFVGPIIPDDPDEDVPNDSDDSNMAVWEMASNEQIGDMWLNGDISFQQARTYLMMKNTWSTGYASNWLNEYEMQKYGN